MMTAESMSLKRPVLRITTALFLLVLTKLFCHSTMNFTENLCGDQSTIFYKMADNSKMDGDLQDWRSILLFCNKKL